MVRIARLESFRVSSILQHTQTVARWFTGWVGLSALAMGCGAEPDPVVLEPRSIEPLAEPGRWMAFDPAGDPWVRRRPSSVECEPGFGYYVEDFAGTPSLKVDTGWCNFLTLEQPTLVDLRADEVIDLKVHHFRLVADAPAEAMLGLALDGVIVWEHRVPIPSPAGLDKVVIELDADYPVGTPMQFHLDNHGDNNWILVRLEREPG